MSLDCHKIWSNLNNKKKTLSVVIPKYGYGTEISMKSSNLTTSIKSSPSKSIKKQWFLEPSLSSISSPHLWTTGSNWFKISRPRNKKKNPNNPKHNNNNPNKDQLNNNNNKNWVLKTGNSLKNFLPLMNLIIGLLSVDGDNNSWKNKSSKTNNKNKLHSNHPLAVRQSILTHVMDNSLW